MTAEEVVGGRYQLLETLGRGGMSDVYRAHDRVLGRDVALKRVRERGLTAEDEARAVAEARTLARLNHPGLIGVYDAGVDDGRPYLVMELVQGRSLRECCVGSPIAADVVARIGTQVAQALDNIHGQGLIHRDIKPANILVAGFGTATMRALVADFGIATMVDATRVTATGFTVGTASYLAPEQVRGAPVTSAVDVYALGLVLLECLTGVQEYTGPPIEAAMARLHRQPRIPEFLSPRWRSLLAQMCLDDPRERPTAAAVAEQLAAPEATEAAIETKTNTATTAATKTKTLVMPVGDTARFPSPTLEGGVPTAPVRAARRLRSSMLIAGAAALTVVVAAVVAVAASSGSPPRATLVPSPAVSGQPGADLATLHAAVNP